MLKFDETIWNSRLNWSHCVLLIVLKTSRFSSFFLFIIKIEFNWNSCRCLLEAICASFWIKLNWVFWKEQIWGYWSSDETTFVFKSFCEAFSSKVQWPTLAILGARRLTEIHLFRYRAHIRFMIRFWIKEHAEKSVTISTSECVNEIRHCSL